MKSSDLKQKLILVYALAAITVVVIVVVGLLILNGTDDDDDSPSIAREEGSGGGGDDDGDGEDSGEPPPLRTVAVERGEGKNAFVSASSPSLEKPKEVWLRVSAAPKQEVNGSWNVSCGRGNVVMDTFKVTPPHLMKLEVPGNDPETCIVGSSGQLKNAGRLKLSILRDR